MTYVGSKRALKNWLFYCFEKEIKKLLEDSSSDSLELWDLTIGGFNTLQVWSEIIPLFSKKITKIHLNDINNILVSFIAHRIECLEKNDFSLWFKPTSVSKHERDGFYEWWKENTNTIIGSQDLAIKTLWSAFIQTFNGSFWGSHVEYEKYKSKFESSWNKTIEAIDNFWKVCKEHDVEIELHMESINNITLSSNMNFVYIDPPYVMSEDLNKRWYPYEFKPTFLKELLEKNRINIYNDKNVVLVSEANLEWNEFDQTYGVNSYKNWETFLSKSTFSKHRFYYERLWQVFINDSKE